MIGYKTSCSLVLVLLGLTGCKITEPEPYQKDREPEQRTQYNGAEGLVQQQKDQSYLMGKELRDKCEAARVDKLVAESQGDDAAVARQQSIIEKTCR